MPQTLPLSERNALIHQLVEVDLAQPEQPGQLSQLQLAQLSPPARPRQTGLPPLLTHQAPAPQHLLG
jgi:hypothetical protein